MRPAVVAVALLLLPTALAAGEPFALVLRVPALVEAGVIVHAEGELTLGGLPVPNEPVRIRQDGLSRGSTTTGVDGSYAFLVVAGARGTHTVQTFADPVRATFHLVSEPQTYTSVVAPTAVVAVAADAVPYSLYVDVTWSPPSDDGGAPVTRYEVFRDDGTSDAKIATLTGDARAFRDKVPPLTTWTYRVRAWNMAGEGPFASAAFTSPDLPYADTFTADAPVYRRCWETTDCSRSWSTPIRTTTQPFQFWVPVQGALASYGYPLSGVPVTGRVTATLPGESPLTLETSTTTRPDGTYEALVGPFVWGPDGPPHTTVHYVPISVTAMYGATTYYGYYHQLVVQVGNVACEYDCGGW